MPLALLAVATLAACEVHQLAPAVAPPPPVLVLLGLIHAGVDQARPKDTRRGRFVPDASRAALDEMASDIRKLRVRRHGTATYPAMGRVDAALHALLGLTPYPNDPDERELMEDALRCLEAAAPDVAHPLAERMHAHYLTTAPGGARRAE